MPANNLIAEGVKTHGVRTFPDKEMAFSIHGLMHPLLFDVAQVEPVWAGFDQTSLWALVCAAEALSKSKLFSPA
jgi:3-oxoacyl-ACP reductase-like protein